MLITEGTCLEENRVAVPPQAIAFPQGCLLCGDKNATPTNVAFTSVLVLGLLGGIESVMVPVPLCAQHDGDYRSHMMKKNITMIVLFIAGMAFGLASLFSEPRKNPPEFIFCLPLGIALIVGSFVVMLRKFKAFPVRFKANQGPLFQGHSAYVFTFPTREIAERFAKANDSEATVSHEKK